MSRRTGLAALAALATALTAMSLSGVYVDPGWRWPTLGAIVAAFLGAELGSRLGARLLLPSFWRGIGGATAVVMLACARYAPSESWLGFLPTPGAVTRLRELTIQAFDDIHSLAAPVPSHDDLVLVTMVGVGFIAVLVDLLSVRAALTGLPLLALYSVPEWLSPHGTGAIGFLAAAAGYLLLLVREGRDRATRWGRTIGTSADSPFGELVASPSGTINQVGRRIGVAALGAALVLPPLLPGLDHPHLFGFGSGPGNGHGTVVVYNPITRIYGFLHESEPTEQLRYTVAKGAVGGLYLKWTTLDRFDDAGWSQSELNGAGTANSELPRPDVQQFGIPAKPLDVSITVDDLLDLRWLPVPMDTTSVRGVSDQWVYDAASLTIFSPHSNTRNLDYDVSALTATPSARTLLASPAVNRASTTDTIRHYLDLPTGTSPPVQREAERITKRYRTPYQKALALQQYFTDTGGFRYDTDAGSGNGTDLLADFVLRNKRGFCEQFASAMAIMARMVGIPSRVAVGFTPGLADGRGDEYVVTTADAHAWPELYFEGIGWLRFEPTPRSDGQASPPAYATQGPAGVEPAQQPNPAPSASTGPGARDPRGINGLRNLDNTDPLRHTTVPPLTAPDSGPRLTARTIAVIALALALLVLLAAMPVSRLLSRRRRHLAARDPVTRAHVAWTDVVTDASDLGFRLAASDSPRAAAHRLTARAGLNEDAAAALHRLARAEERARYAPALPAVGDVEGDARLVSARMRAGAGHWTRLRARLLPPSTVRAASDAVGRGVEAVFGAVDAAAGRVGALARRLVPPAAPSRFR